MKIDPKEKIVENILKKLKPDLSNEIKKKNYDFMKDDYLDSFDIINILVEIEKKSKKKINMSKVSQKSFSNIKKVLSLSNLEP